MHPIGDLQYKIICMFYYLGLLKYFGALRRCHIPALPEIFYVILKQEIIYRALCITVMNSQKEISILFLQ